jgi:hypothetical protein
VELLSAGFLLKVLLDTLNSVASSNVEAAAVGSWARLLRNAKRLLGRDQASLQRKAFAKAARSAVNLTIRKYPSQEQAERVLSYIDRAYGKVEDRGIALELAKVLTFSEEPDIRRLTRLIEVQEETFSVGTATPGSSSQEIAAVLVDFIENLRRALLDQPEYAHLISKETLRHQQAIRRALNPITNDDESAYKLQMKQVFGRIYFTGIPGTSFLGQPSLPDLYIDVALERFRPANKQHFEAARDESSSGAVGDLEVQSFPETGLASAICQTQSVKAVILGDPGSGKTTLLKQIATSVIETNGKPSGYLPIFASLREFPLESDALTFEQFLVQHMNRHLSLNLPQDFFRRYLEVGRCVVCLDGIDEVLGVGAQAKLANLINGFVSRFPNNRIFVTSRIAGYSGPLDAWWFAQYRIQPLSFAQIEGYLTNWYRMFEPDASLMNQRVKELSALVSGDPRLASLASNPLLLTIIALIHQHESVLPKERFRLYEKCITTMMDTWDQAKRVVDGDGDRLFYRNRRTILEGIAYKMQLAKSTSNEQPSLGIRELENLIAESLVSDPRTGLTEDHIEFAKEEARRYIHHMQTRAGMLVPLGDRALTFPHLTFQEFLAASYFDAHFGHLGFDELWNQLEGYLLVPTWREVVLLLLGIFTRSRKLPTLFVQRMLDQQTTDPLEIVLHRKLFLAAEALIEGVELEGQVRQEVINRLLHLVFSGPQASSPWWGEAGEALALLRRMKGEDYVIESVERIIYENSRSGPRREPQFQLLAEVGGKQARALLKKFIQDTTHPFDERFYAAQALITFGCHDRDVGDVLKEYVRGSRRDGRTIHHLARYFARCKSDDRTIFETLMDWAVSNAPGWVTGPALEGVILIGLERLEYAQEVIQFLQKLVTESSSNERVIHRMYPQAGVALIGMSDVIRKWKLEPVPCLALADQLVLNSRQNHANRVAALIVLHSWDSITESVQHAAMDMVEDRDCEPITRVELVRVLETFPDSALSNEKASTLLKKMAADPGIPVRGRVWALNQLIVKGSRDNETVGALMRIASGRHGEWIIASEAADALGRLDKGDRRAIAALSSMARDPANTHWVRGAALRALGNIADIKDTATVDMLKEAAAQDVDVRQHAYDGLKRLMEDV